MNGEWETLRDTARNARKAAAESVRFAERWLNDADSKTYRSLAEGLKQKLNDPTLTRAQRAQIKHHRNLLQDAHEAELAWRDGSEWAGDRGGTSCWRTKGTMWSRVRRAHPPEHTSSPGAGRFDQVGISGPGIESATGRSATGERYAMTFQENKGGDSPQLGSRKSFQQGTMPYLEDLLTGNSDPRLREKLLELHAEGRYPGFFKALRNGEVTVRYQYANARTNGTLRTGAFDLGGEVRIRWDGGDTFELITQEPS